MSLVFTAPTVAQCRRGIAPACDPANATQLIAAGAAPPTVPPTVDGQTLFMRKGDVLDFGIDFSAWTAANDAIISGAVWAAYAGSPKAPTISAQGIDATLNQAVVVIDATAAAFGDTYWLQCTAQFTDATPNVANTYTFPARQMSRIIIVQVVL